MKKSILLLKMDISSILSVFVTVKHTEGRMSDADNTNSNMIKRTHLKKIFEQMYPLGKPLPSTLFT